MGWSNLCPSTHDWLPCRPGRIACCACAAAVFLLALGFGSVRAQDNPNEKRLPGIPRIANEPPDANAIMMMQQRKHRDLQFDAANAERKRRLNEEATMLLRLAGEVKQEVDRNDPAFMRFTYRKTELIERLARDVQEKMKLTVAK
jgi:hypothetical protein